MSAPNLPHAFWQAAQALRVPRMSAGERAEIAARLEDLSAQIPTVYQKRKAQGDPLADMLRARAEYRLARDTWKAHRAAQFKSKG